LNKDVRLILRTSQKSVRNADQQKKQKNGRDSAFMVEQNIKKWVRVFLDYFLVLLAF
jgi:hypothetical protein